MSSSVGYTYCWGMDTMPVFGDIVQSETLGFTGLSSTRRRGTIRRCAASTAPVRPANDARSL